MLKCPQTLKQGVGLPDRDRVRIQVLKKLKQNTNKTEHFTIPPMTKLFPYQHFVDEEQNLVWVYYNGGGQLGRYGVPQLIKKFYPGYTYKFCSEEQLKQAQAELRDRIE
jgi:hypothetical protein